MFVIGKSVIRNDAVSKAEGRAVFVADDLLPGMLHAAVLRSPFPHAKILKVDDRPARRLEGVAAILWAKDIPGKNIVHVIRDDQPLLAEKIVRYAGEPVAVVAARDEQIAGTALNLIEIEYKPLPAVTDFEQARSKTAAQIYKDRNTFSHYKIRKGDVEAAFTGAAFIFSGTFRTPYQEHAYLEPQGMIAVPEDDGLLVTGSMQCPFYVQGTVADVTGLPLARVRVKQATTGGAFGGKEDVPSLVAGQAALPAHYLQKPVRLIYRRDEDMISMSKRHPSRVDIKMACDENGKLLAVETKYVIDGGAYATLSPVVLWRGAVHAAGAYSVPNVKVDAYAVATNHVPCGAYRGFGSPQVLFAVESALDELARLTGLDTAEIRRRNLLQEGETTATGYKIVGSCGLTETFEQAMQQSDWLNLKKKFSRQTGPVRHGLGISTIFYGVGLGAGGKQLARTGAFLQIDEDASVQIAVGTTEMGQGMQTVLRQIAAECLAVSYESVAILPVDTSRVPDSGPTVASRATTMSGLAILNACEQVKSIMIAVAAEMLQAAPESVQFRDGCFFADQTKKIFFSHVVKKCHELRKPMAVQGFAVSPDTGWDPETGQGKAYVVYAYATNIVQVAVDVRTGETTLEKVWAAHDIGKAINPQTAEGQIEGGSVQGLGYGLMEDMSTNGERIMNTDFATYMIPTAEDAPRITPIIVEHPFREGPFGAKGFGEQPLMGMAPALVNAIQDAVGVRITELPATAEKVWELLNAGMV
ncbi:MAG TPA: xanthine dehydrogenase [Bacteroidetes bacterium]|nr:xanthine dehydrogenase [Bacteroidota bacterium]